MSAATPFEALREAVNYLELHGWAQGRFRLESGACCLEGAVRVVTVGDALARTNRVGQRALRAVSRDVGRWPSGWNDEEGRTFEQVVSQLRVTANRLEREGVSG